METFKRKAARAGAGTLAAMVAMGLAMSPDASGADKLAGRVWLAETIQNGGVAPTVQSTVSFDAGGKVTGSGGCNRLFGSVKVSGGSLAFSAFGTTRMACAPAVMQQEQKFLAALAATRAYRFEGAKLKFYDTAGTELIGFIQL
jgi:heat shock protein HslJ